VDQASQKSRWPALAFSDQAPSPQWALAQRRLLKAASAAVSPFLARYTRDDGTVLWRDEWPGMDGSDDAYEGFASLPLLYLLGGSDELLALGRKQWEAMTRQFTGYGQVHNEFDAYYDWMHHGESSHLLYYLGLADPADAAFRERAARFAGMYLGEDPEADNWDAERKLIRSPINGSRGPRFEMTAEDWCTHRAVLDNYLAPYEDIPGHPTNHDPQTKLPWTDDAVFAGILRLMNQRMARGDVPLNLTATGLVTHAFLYTGEEKCRRWVVDYYDAWRRQTEQNGGVMPDNVGPSGVIGECMGGKWWGGYYGYRWPHGWRNLAEATLVAAGNVLLLTGDFGCLDLPRSLLDGFWALGEERDGTFVIPHRHGDGGWFDYRPPNPDFWAHLYHLSQSEEDLERLSRFPDREQWASRHGGFGKSPICYRTEPWLAWLAGDNPQYPADSLTWACQEVDRRLAVIANDDSLPDDQDVHHWQQRCPVIAGPLPQQTMGADTIYHGGLLQARLRYFDPVQRRPGLPEGVAALVEELSHDGVLVAFANTDPSEAREVLVQAGAFGEHRFTEVVPVGNGRPAGSVNAECFQVRLAPASQVELRVGMERYVNRPRYRFPWR
jgi:hypothetical protein